MSTTNCSAPAVVLANSSYALLIEANAWFHPHLIAVGKFWFSCLFEYIKVMIITIKP